MEKVQQTDNGWTKFMRWTARLMALLAVGLFVIFVAGSGLSVLSAISWTSPQGVPLVAALLLALAGALVAWRWELVGGIMTMAGVIGIMALVCAGSGTDMLYCAFLFTLPLLVAGALYLACCWKTKSAARQQEA